jgi:ribosomal protein S18 acetylase RimI-like enzyme
VRTLLFHAAGWVPTAIGHMQRERLSLEPVDVRELREHEQRWLRATLRERWDGEIMIGRGRVRKLDELRSLVAVDGAGERVGPATYVVEHGVAELVTIDAFEKGAGVGRRLLDALAESARAAGARRLLVMTTNDNLTSLRFYQRAGFRLLELRPGAVDEARAIKPSIPTLGHDGIPIRDEIDLVLDLYECEPELGSVAGRALIAGAPPGDTTRSGS